MPPAGSTARLAAGRRGRASGRSRGTGRSAAPSRGSRSRPRRRSSARRSRPCCGSASPRASSAALRSRRCVPPSTRTRPPVDARRSPPSSSGAHEVAVGQRGVRPRVAGADRAHGRALRLRASHQRDQLLERTTGVRSRAAHSAGCRCGCATPGSGQLLHQRRRAALGERGDRLRRVDAERRSGRSSRRARTGPGWPCTRPRSSTTPSAGSSAIGQPPSGWTVVNVLSGPPSSA